MNKIKALVLSTFMLLGIGLVFVQPASAITVFPTCNNSTAGSNSEVCAGKDEQADGLIKMLVNTLLYIVGALAVVVIIVSGILYVVSNGDANNIERAKSMLTYAVVGLVVAFIAYAIVNWVLNIFA